MTVLGLHCLSRVEQNFESINEKPCPLTWHTSQGSLRCWGHFVAAWLLPGQTCWKARGFRETSTIYVTKRTDGAKQDASLAASCAAELGSAPRDQDKDRPCPPTRTLQNQGFILHIPHCCNKPL